jgi:phosphatidylglycerol:prolipoprotein diacylglycerol transferase
MSIIYGSDIYFPNLGISLENVVTGINVFGYTVTFYGIVVGIGMLCGWLIAEWMAKWTGQNTELYLDFAMVAIVAAVIGARAYYVVFTLEEFVDNPLSIFNLRTGGLAIYGGIIAAVLAAVVYARIKKYNFWLLADTSCVGLVIGQSIGRWGNFFNREAFGKYTDGLFAMRLNVNDISGIFRDSTPVSRLQNMYSGKSQVLERILEIRDKTVMIEGSRYIQVHPTFLYESLWNACLLIILVLYTKHKKFDGEIILLYLVGYGLGRVWMEGLRTDQLFLWGTPIAVSQLLSGVVVILAGAYLIYRRYGLIRKRRR